MNLRPRPPRNCSATPSLGNTALKDGHLLPSLFILLPSKTQATYLHTDVATDPVTLS